jgi:hypothetical protein
MVANKIGGGGNDIIQNHVRFPVFDRIDYQHTQCVAVLTQQKINGWNISTVYKFEVISVTVIASK